jgi:hypothetical protein
MNFVHCLVLQKSIKKTRFRNWVRFCARVKGLEGPYYLEGDKDHKQSNIVCKKA